MMTAVWRRAHTVRFSGAVLLIGALVGGACTPVGSGGGDGPGHRKQALGLTPEQELSLGRQAYKEVLSKARIEPNDSRDSQRVRQVGQRIVKAVQIEPLQREINLKLRGYTFEWEFKVLANEHINAFCLPGGKVAVFTGLLPVANTDDFLATVMSHEIAHALAHHASERVARESKLKGLLEVANGVLGNMAPQSRRELIGVLAAGAQLGALHYNRDQESEADHIGVFLMTFAGYDPHQAVVFWGRMQQASHGGRVPQIISDHPSDAQRIKDMRKWAEAAAAGKKAFDEGRIAPARGR